MANYIDNGEDNVVVNGTSGDDDIYNYNGSNVKINAGEGNDTVYNDRGSNVTIDAGEGNDSIENWGENATINAGDGNDSISNIRSNVSIDSGNGNDTISNSGSTVTIDVGDGDDTVYNSGSNVTINAGVGADTVSNVGGRDVMINAGADDDHIFSSGDSVTINAGAGNDIIRLGGDSSFTVLKYAAGDGNDSITAFNYTDTLHITDDSEYSTLKSGSDVIVSIGSGSIVLKNYSSTVNIEGGTFVELGALISNSNANTLISGTSLDDTIGNSDWSTNVTIDAGAGDDYIFNDVGSNVTINAGNGDDLINLSGDSSLVVIGYTAGDGNDTVIGYKSSDTIKIIGASEYSTVGSGSDVIVSIESGSIVLKNYSSTVKIVGGTQVGSSISNSNANTLLTGTPVDDTIYNDGDAAIIDAGAGDDSVYNRDGSTVMIDAGAGNDSIRNWSGDAVTINAGVGADYVDNSGNLAMIDGGAGNDSIFNSGGDSVKIVGGDGDDSIHNRDGLSVMIDAGVGDDTIRNTGNAVTINSGAGNDSVYNGGDSVTINAGAGNDSIYNYEGSNVTLNAGAGNDRISLGGGSARIFFQSGDGNDTVTGYNFSDTIRITDGSSYSTTINGSDVIISIGSGSIRLINAADKSVNISGGIALEPAAIRNYVDNVKVSGTAGNDRIINNSAGVTLQGNAGNDTIEGSANGELILVASDHGNNLITNFGVNDTLKCMAGKIATVMTVGADAVVSLKGSKYSGTVTLAGVSDYRFNYSSSTLMIEPINEIVNEADGVKVSGTSGADSIVNSGAGVTIQGLAGDDTIVGSDNGDLILVASNHGNDVVTNFGANDTLKCTAGKIVDVTPIGDDAVVSLKGSTYSGTVTLQGAGAYQFKHSSSYLTVNEIVNTLDGVKIVGTSGADSIKNGGLGVTIQGNSGNDTITGSDNAEMILVASNHGNDVVTNFGENDTLKCTAGKIATVTTIGDDAVVSLKGSAYSGSVTLAGAADYRFDYSNSILKVDSSASNVADYWFTAEEPIVEENALDQIVQSNAALAVPEEPLFARFDNPFALSTVEPARAARHRLKK